MQSIDSHKSLFALIDCNSFFVSCERVFNPQLLNRPVIVLSSNDGCIVARSKEAKDLGIPMGAPFFQWADFCRHNNVISRSSNFPLYADLSHRVMQTIAHFYSAMEIYSIDECFLCLDHFSDGQVLSLCEFLKKKIWQWVGIPVSIGIGATKTLSKVANHCAKHQYYEKGLFFLKEENEQEILTHLPVGKIWGIGRRLEELLHKKGIKTAWALRNCQDDWIKKQLSVVGLRTVWELRGIPCLSVEELPTPKKSIISSRTFGRLVTKKEELAEAVATYTTRAAEKMRSQESMANYLEIFIYTSPHREEPYYGNAVRIHFPEPTDYTPLLISYAKQGLEKIFLANHLYKKAGILLGGLVPATFFQQNLFLPQDETARMLFKKKQALMQLVDRANQKFGYDILQPAATGIERPWKMQQEQRSAAFTTCWDELLTIQI